MNTYTTTLSLEITVSDDAPAAGDHRKDFKNGVAEIYLNRDVVLDLNQSQFLNLIMHEFGHVLFKGAMPENLGNLLSHVYSDSILP